MNFWFFRKKFHMTLNTCLFMSNYKSAQSFMANQKYLSFSRISVNFTKLFVMSITKFSCVFKFAISKFKRYLISRKLIKKLAKLCTRENIYYWGKLKIYSLRLLLSSVLFGNCKMINETIYTPFYLIVEGHIALFQILTNAYIIT